MGDVVATGVCDRFRQDLMEAGIGDGAHGFLIRLSASVALEAELHIVEVASGAELSGSPIPLSPGAAVEVARPLLSHDARIEELVRGADARRRQLARLYADLKRREGYLSDAADTEPLRATGLMDVVVLPPIDWDYRIQRPQQLAMAWADLGCRVFYVSTDFLQPEPDGPAHALLRRSHPGVLHVRLQRPLPHPPLNTTPIVEADLPVLVESYKLLAEQFGITRPVLVVGSPGWEPLAAALPGTRVYDCMDRFDAFGFATPGILVAETRLLRSADLVLTASKPLRQYAEASGARTVLVPNAASRKLFAAAQPATGGPTVAGYVGAVEDWFDAELLARAAVRLPDARFEVHGHVGSQEAAERLSGLPNVILYGELPQERLVTVLEGFDVALIPFKRTQLIEHTNPVKVYEYLAAGLPVVATPMPELAPFGSLVSIAEEPNDFADAVSAAARTRRDPASISARRMAVAEETWAARAIAAYDAVASVRLSLRLFLLWRPGQRIDTLRAWLEAPLAPRKVFVLTEGRLEAEALARAAVALPAFDVVSSPTDERLDGTEAALFVDPTTQGSESAAKAFFDSDVETFGPGWARATPRAFSQAWLATGALLLPGGAAER